MHQPNHHEVLAQPMRCMAHIHCLQWMIVKRALNSLNEEAKLEVWLRLLVRWLTSVAWAMDVKQQPTTR